ncbi:hypothetical protein U1Q18_007422, partial [Sarracenia purpurea var. burkii]
MNEEAGRLEPKRERSLSSSPGKKWRKGRRWWWTEALSEEGWRFSPICGGEKGGFFRDGGFSEMRKASISSTSEASVERGTLDEKETS